jgi:hypothetical protein
MVACDLDIIYNGPKPHPGMIGLDTEVWTSFSSWAVSDVVPRAVPQSYCCYIDRDSLHACKQQTNISNKLSRVVAACRKPLKTSSANFQAITSTKVSEQ